MKGRLRGSKREWRIEENRERERERVRELERERERERIERGRERERKIFLLQVSALNARA